ncbi:Transcription elongation factor GreA [bioreactor metagenome]|uniref:Transcription elongation factor GreA n=1 Tax=bioreactor metagenome TaxID=1076179 RepID=A0A645IYH1_9ZZZZ
MIGCTVALRFEDGVQEIYQLLGAWDGDPERNWLSYKTRLGEAVYGHKVGSRLTVPGNRVCVLESVRPLPSDVLDELD